MAEKRFVHHRCLCCGQEVSSSQDFCSGHCETAFFDGKIDTSSPNRL